MAVLHSQIEGKYEILEKIKEGGMGAVYKVRHRFLEEIRVVKVIRSSLEPTTELSDRFLREARVAIRLRHPNIAALHDFAIAEAGSAYIVMEYIEGLTLEDILRAHGPPPLGLTLEIAQQSLKAIGYLHRRGFVHRDIAPDNLMLTRGIDGEPLVKLIDLGIAKVLEGDGEFTSTGMFLGKPRYASPEHFGAEGGIDGRSDLYSFGVVLYELATGQAPVLGRDPASFMAGHLLRPPRDFGETDPEGRVPAELRELLLWALAKRSAERVASAEELARGLAPLAARFPVQPGELEELLRPPAPREPERPPGTAADGSTQDRLDRQFGNVTTPPPELRGPPLAAVPAPATLALDGMGGPPSDPLGRTVPLARSGDPDWQCHPLQPATPAARAGAQMSPASVDNLGWRRADPPSAGSAGAVAGRAQAEEEWGAWVKPAAGLAVLVIALGGGSWWYLRGTAPAPSPADAPLASGVAPGSPGAGKRTAAPAPAATAAPSGAPAPSPVDAPAARKAAGPAPVGRARAAPTSSGAAPAPVAPPAPAGEGGDGDRSGLIEAGPGVEAAEPTSVPDAVYPSGARGSGLQPRVLIAVLIDEKGQVAEARVKSGDPSGLGFNEAALAAVKRARFLPATRNGVPGRSWSELMIEFSAPPAAPPPSSPPPLAGPAPVARAHASHPSLILLRGRKRPSQLA